MANTEIGVSVHTIPETKVEGKVVGSSVWVDIGGCTIFLNSPETAQRIAKAFANVYESETH